MRGGTANGEHIDALIVTAVREECDAVRDVDTGAVAGSAWEERETSTGLELFVRSFGVESGVLQIAVTRAFGMGREQAVMAAAPLLERHPTIRCLAMCGVCAGRRDDVALGDVIIADRTWPYDEGKRKVVIDDHGNRIERFLGDMDLYRIHPPEWKHRAERFIPDPGAPWLARPTSYEDQGNWLLERLARGENPILHHDRKTKCPNYESVVKQLWKLKWLADGELTLTEAGQKHIRRLMTLQPDGLRDAGPFKVVVGPVASGAPVVEDPTIFERLVTESAMRKVIGLEMETSAILALAYLKQLPFAIVMKGVMDHADVFKSDNMKTFAARASAECLIAFLRENLPPHAAKEPLDNLLVPGTSEPPEEASPAALLNARHEVVPFFGRTELLQEIHSWCDNPASVRARLFYGPGGMGKTRLFIEACARLRREGWRAGFVPGDVDRGQLEALIATERPTLAVIDYAESRPDLRDLLAPAAHLRAGKGWGRLRLVLLARNSGDWWTFLQGSDAQVGTLLGDHAPRELLPVVAKGHARAVAFQEAAVRFARILGKPVPLATPSLDDRRYDRVLYVHMAALATVEGWQFTPDTLIGSMLDHEQRFWSSRFPHGEFFDAQRFTERMRRAVAALTLRGGTSSRDAAAMLVGRTMGERDERIINRYVLFLHALYPGQRDASGGRVYLGGLEPDLLGEAMVHRTLSLEDGNASTYLDRVFDRVNEDALRTAFSVLGLLSENHPEDADPWLAHLLGRDVASRSLPAFAAAKAIGERTAHARLGTVLARALEREGTVELAAQMQKAGLPERTVSLREVVLWAENKLLEYPPEGSDLDILAERARLLNNLGERLSALGQREAALTSTLAAVAHYRTLVEQRPDAFLPVLAISLNNLGNRQSELGQREAALASTQEAVGIRRRLAIQLPDAFLPDLAASLNNLGGRQSDLGQPEAALASTQEAVDIRRRLAKQRPDAFLPDLAGSLSNLGIFQREVGRREAALALTQEAVAICRTLAEQQPDAFLPDLAMSLNNLGITQSELGQRGAALASIHEAVDIRRKLTEQRPDAFMPDLAMSLNNLGNQQCELGQQEAALASTQESVNIRRRLVKHHPDAFMPDLAGSLSSLSVRQSAMGQRKAALYSIQEAVVIHRELAEQRPDAFMPDLAMGLTNLGNRQSAVGQCEAALASTQEAVAIHRRLAEQQPDAFLPDLAMSLNNLGITQSELGQRGAALASIHEAVDIRRKLTEQRPDAFLPNVAISLDNLGGLQSELEQHEAALSSVQEALDVIWPFFLALPPAFGGVTSSILHKLSQLLEMLDQPASPELLKRIELFQSKSPK